MKQKNDVERRFEMGFLEDIFAGIVELITGFFDQIFGVLTSLFDFIPGL